MFGSNIKGMEWNYFITILLLDPYFKINCWIYRDILGVIVKKFIKFNFIASYFFQFLRTKIWDFKRIKKSKSMFGNCFFPLFSVFKNNFLFLKLKNLFGNSKWAENKNCFQNSICEGNWKHAKGCFQFLIFKSQWKHAFNLINLSYLMS